VRSPFCAGVTVEWNLKHAMRVTGLPSGELMIDDEGMAQKVELGLGLGTGGRIAVELPQCGMGDDWEGQCVVTPERRPGSIARAL
jgi:hypothetical protein